MLFSIERDLTLGGMRSTISGESQVEEFRQGHGQRHGKDR